MCLRRKDVKKLLIAKSEGKMKFFDTMHVGDEFFLTVIGPLNKNKYVNFEVTYDDWDYTKNEVKKIDKLTIKAYTLYENKNASKKEKEKYLTQIYELKSLKKITASHPKTIVNVEEDIDNINRVDSYFYRKFAKNSNINDYWNNIINNKN